MDLVLRNVINDLKNISFYIEEKKIIKTYKYTTCEDTSQNYGRLMPTVGKV